MTGCRLTSSMPAMMRSLSSCFDATRGGIEETSASFEARTAPRSYPTKPAMTSGGAAARSMDDIQCLTTALSRACGPIVHRH
jgi:hypothetical protein